MAWFERSLNSLLRSFFHLLYHEFAWTYDWVAAIVSVGNWKRWVLAVLPFIENGPVLEIGYGPGHLQTALTEGSSEVFGVDASAQMSRIAARRLRRAGIKFRLSRAFAQAMPFPESTFATIVATFPSEFIADPKTLNEIWRILFPGGRLIIVPFAWIMGSRLHERAAAWLFQITRQSLRIPMPEGELSDGELDLDDLAESEPWFRYFCQPARLAGFELTGTTIYLENSLVILLIAEKPVHPLDR